jgi:multisubunit Na+/H+ antiporter MnhF subunit
MDSLPLVLKIVFALPCLDILWAIYRIIKGVNAKDTVAIVIDILLLVFGSWSVMWLVDIITLLLNGKVLDFIGLGK